MVTPFQQKVYSTVKKIPPGKVSTYKLLALAVGCGSPRAIGQALRCNPFAPAVPCHRIIRSDLTIGGFAGDDSGEQVVHKEELLRKEGVFFQAGKLVDRSLLYTF